MYLISTQSYHGGWEYQGVFKCDDENEVRKLLNNIKVSMYYDENKTKIYKISDVLNSSDFE